MDANETFESEDADIEKVKDYFEKMMMDLPAGDLKSNASYIGGYLDCLEDTGQITENQRDTLYLDYVG